MHNEFFAENLFRIIEFLPNKTRNKQMEGETKILYLLVVSLFTGFASNGGELSGWKGLMQNVWGVSSKICRALSKIL